MTRGRSRLAGLFVVLGLIGALLALPSLAGAQEADGGEAAGVAAAEDGTATTSAADGAISAAACTGGRTISGSIRGSNGRQVNALIGLVLLNANGDGIGLNGAGQGGYAVTRAVNSGLPPEGQPASVGTEFCFNNLPGNATSFWIEAYPKEPGGSTNRTYFGGSVLRGQALPGGGRSGVSVILPATCGNGGNTGGITVHGYVNGVPRGITRVSAFATGQGAPPYGFGVDSPPSVPVFTLSALVPNQRYSVYVGLATSPAQQRRFDNILVRPCANTDLYWNIGTTRFRDVSVSNPFYDDIEWMAHNEITTGFGNGLFKPLNVVTRQAMAAFMYRLAGEPAFTPPGAPSFSDVATSSPFFKEVEWLSAEGISTGYDDHTFRPFAHVTRGAMSAFMYRLAGEPAFTPPGTPSFTDVPLDHAFFTEIEWMADVEVTTGYTDGTYKPGAGVTRQAMSAFMHRLAALLD